MTPEAIERMYDLDEGVTYAPGPVVTTESAEEREAIRAWLEQRFGKSPEAVEKARVA